MDDIEVKCKNGTWDGYDEKKCQNIMDYDSYDSTDSTNDTAYTGTNRYTCVIVKSMRNLFKYY